MLTHAVLLAGLLLAGDDPPDTAKTDYLVGDLLGPDPRSDDDRYLSDLLQIEKDSIPYPGGELAPLPQPTPADPVLGYYPPSKTLLGRLSPLGYYPPGKNLLEKRLPKR